MLLRRVLFVLGFVLASFPQCGVAAQDLADVIERCEKSVVKIQVEGKGGESLGSGFVVSSKGIFVTNVHVLAGAKKATAIFNTGKSCEITGTYYFDESRDICVAQLDGEGFTPIEIKQNNPRKGETVIALGAPVGLDFTATTGIVSAIREGKKLGKELEGEWIQIDAALSPGNSGGPLVNKSGIVVGMSTLASRGDMQNLNFGISSGDIVDAIEIAKGESLISFKDGIADVRTPKSGGLGVAPTPALPTSRPDIPEEKIVNFASSCAEQYTDLVAETLELAKTREKQCRVMMRGRIKPLFFGGMEFVKGARGRPDRVIYSNEVVKNREVRKAKKELSVIEKFRSEVGEECTERSLLSLIKFAAPAIDLRKANDVGILRNFTASKIPSDNLAVGAVETRPSRIPMLFSDGVILWMSSTDEMSTRSVAMPVVVFVATPLDRISVEFEIGGGNRGDQKRTLSVSKPAVLVEIDDAELKKAIEGLGLEKGASEKPAGEMRQWTAGKFKVKAIAMSWNESTVTLKKENGKVTTVKKSILSKEDREFLSGLSK